MEGGGFRGGARSGKREKKTLSKMSKNFLASLNAMDDDDMDYEGLMAQVFCTPTRNTHSTASLRLLPSEKVYTARRISTTVASV